MSFVMFKKHKRTPAELATKLNVALESLSKGGAEKVRSTRRAFCESPHSSEISSER